MKDEKQETIADIVAEMRLGVKDWKGERLGVFDCFADRIEAAHQREICNLSQRLKVAEDALRKIQERLVASVYDGTIDPHEALKIAEDALAAMFEEGGAE